MKVRLKGLDTAEMKGKKKCEKQMAFKAKDKVAQILTGAKRIDLVNVEREKYFRILAQVFVDGKDLGQILLKDSLAIKYNGGTKSTNDWCGL